MFRRFWQLSILISLIYFSFIKTKFMMFAFITCDIITLRHSNYENETTMYKNAELVILKIKWKTLCKTHFQSSITFQAAKIWSENITRFVWPFWQILSKDLRGILNSAISFRWSHQRSRTSIHISGPPSEKRKICFPGVENGNGAVRSVPVAFPNFRSRETGRWMPNVYDPQRAILVLPYGTSDV